MAHLYCITAVLMLSLCSTVFGTRIMACYFQSWSNYRPGNGSFVVEDIDPSLCTHIIYAFVQLDNNANITIMDPNDIEKFSRVLALKNSNPNLKVLISIGGYNDDPVKYSNTFQSATNRSLFASNALSFVQTYGFDGLDIDWEYPAQRGGSASDKTAYTNLMQTVKASFQPHGLLLTAAVGAASSLTSVSYDIPALGAILDYIMLMTYDYQSSSDSQLGYNAPLYGPPENVNNTVQTWLSNGAPAQKLVVGVPMYGYVYNYSSCANPGCPSAGVGPSGPYSQQPGMWFYNEIRDKEYFDIVNYQKDTDGISKTGVMRSSSLYISYDNEYTCRQKANYIISNNLGGAMIWSIDTESFRGICGYGKYPLLTILSSVVAT